MEQIVRFAWARGHRRIAFIQGEKGTVSRERLAGFYKICAELGIRVPVNYIREGHFHDPAESARIIRELLSGGEPPTCVLCPDDYSCLGALWQLEAHGIHVPQDVSLVGYDGIRMSSMMQPVLTTYRQDAKQISAEAFRLLMDAVENPEAHTAQHITVSGTLIKGETLGEV